MKFTDIVLLSAITIAGMFFASVFVSKDWPLIAQRIFKFALASILFVACGIYYLTFKEEVTEAAFRAVLCPFHEFKGCKPDGSADESSETEVRAAQPKVASTPRATSETPAQDAPGVVRRPTRKSVSTADDVASRTDYVLPLEPDCKKQLDNWLNANSYGAFARGRTKGCGFASSYQNLADAKKRTLTRLSPNRCREVDVART